MGVSAVESEAHGAGYVISVNGHPMAELRPFVPVPTPGRFKDAIHFTDDAFAPLADAGRRHVGRVTSLDRPLLLDTDTFIDLGVDVLW